MTIKQALDHAVQTLNEADITGAKLDAELLLANAAGHNRAWVLAHDHDDLPDAQRRSFEQLITRRAKHIPVVHLTGRREFYGLDFKITPDVLTPRIETEVMVDWAIKYAPNSSRLIDIGTGSGAIAVAVATHRPDLSVTATEVSTAALGVAKDNAKYHHQAIEMVGSDLWSNVHGRFHTIVTNLPYLRDDARKDLMPEVKREPAVALFGGSDGLDLYRRLLAGLDEHLEPGGYLFTESDPWQHPALTELASGHGLDLIEEDYFILGFKRRP